jgi:hypothetical protein
LADFPRACEAEMRPHRHAIVPSIIERYAIRFREQRIDLESTGRRSRQPRVPVFFHLGSTSKASAFAAFNGRLGIIKVQQIAQPTLLTGVDPIDHYSNGIEAVPGIRHASTLLVSASQAPVKDWRMNTL